MHGKTQKGTRPETIARKRKDYRPGKESGALQHKAGAPASGGDLGARHSMPVRKSRFPHPGDAVPAPEEPDQNRREACRRNRRAGTAYRPGAGFGFKAFPRKTATNTKPPALFERAMCLYGFYNKPPMPMQRKTPQRAILYHFAPIFAKFSPKIRERAFVIKRAAFLHQTAKSHSPSTALTRLSRPNGSAG